MQIILLQDVKNVGKKGQIKSVPDGYARNFLIAKKMAAPASSSNIAQAKNEEEADRKKIEERKNEIKKLANTLKGKRITIKARAKNGKLFGSITPKDISGELYKKGFDIPEKHIISGNIKELGEKKVMLEMEFGIKSDILILVEKT